MGAQHPPRGTQWLPTGGQHTTGSPDQAEEGGEHHPSPRVRGQGWSNPDTKAGRCDQV